LVVYRRMNFKIWALEIRAPFLILPLILSALGTAMAFFEGSPINPLVFMAFTLVLVLLHVTVNTLNEFYDHRTGIDFHTERSMFNGGSGILQEGLLLPKQVFNVATISFFLALVLSVYLLISVGLILLPIIILGMIFALFYTQIFARNMLGEISAGLGLGALPVLGAFLVQTSTLSPGIWLIALISGLFTFNLLLLNQFPDQAADRMGGRKNLVLRLGERKSALLYTLLTTISYGSLIMGVLLGLFPLLISLGLLTLPFAHKAALAVLHYENKSIGFVSAQGANVKMILFTQGLMTVGLVISVFATIMV